MWHVTSSTYVYLIRCNPLHPLHGALPVPYVPVRVTRRDLVAYRNTYASLRCWTSQYRRTFIPISVPLWNYLCDPVFDGVGLVGFKSKVNAFLFASAACSLFVFYCFPLVFFLSIGWYCGAGVFGLIWCKSLSPSIVWTTSCNHKITGYYKEAVINNTYIFRLVQQNTR